MRLQHIIYSLVLILIAVQIQAQQDSLPSDEVQIIKEFDAQLNDVDKVDIFAPLPELDTTRPISTYQVDPKFLTLTYDAPSIQPLMMKPEALPENFDGYVRIGFGYPIMPWIEGGYQHQQDNLTVGGKARYLGAFDLNQLDNQQFMDIDTDINAEYQFDQGFSLGGHMGYDYDQRFFYGYDHDSLSFEAEDVKQYFSTINGGIFFKNTDKTYNDIHYSIASDIYSITDNYTAAEWGNHSKANFGKYIKEKHLIDISLDNEFIKNTADTSLTNNVLSIMPSFTYHHNKFRVKAGVNASLLNKNFKIYPDVKALANIYKNNIAFYLGWKGWAEAFSFRKLTDTNPFLISNPELNIKETQYPHGGLEFDFNKIQVGIESGYQMVRNQALFVNDYTNDEKRFRVIYDNVDYIITQIHAKAEPIEDLTLGLNLRFQNAKLDSLSENYHDRPDLSANIDLGYHALSQGKLSVGTTIIVSNGTPFLTATGTDDKVKGFVDLNLYTRYRLNDKSHVFLNLNNVTNQKYQQWNAYPNYGFNALVGFMYKF